MLTRVKATLAEDGHMVNMRVGIHTGSIIAGCIGSKAYRYDIWGTDTLVASSLESNGSAGNVVVSESTYQYVLSFTKFSHFIFVLLIILLVPCILAFM